MKRKLKYFAIFLAIVFGFAGFAGIMAKKNSQSTYAVNSTSGNVYGSNVNDGLSFDGEGNLVVTFTVTSNLEDTSDLYHHAWYLYLYDASGECPSYDAESHLVTEELTYIRDEEVLDYNGYYSNIGYDDLTGTIQKTIDGYFPFYHSHDDYGVYFKNLLNAEHDWKVYVGSGYGDAQFNNTTFAVDLYVGTIGANGTIVSDTQEEELSIKFRPVVDGERVYENTAPSEVVVKYYVTYNDGVNAFVLVPSYDKDVFTLLDSENNPRVQVNGIAPEAITVTGNVKNGNDPEFVKIAFDSSTLYSAANEYVAGSDENVLVLTLTFSVHTVPTEYGHFRGEFGLVLNNAGKTNNTSSVAYQDLSGEHLGEQEEVFVRLDVDDPNEVAVPENVVDIYKRHTATITTDAASFTYTYRKQAMPVTKVTEYTSNLTYGVEYKYNGNGDPVVTWKEGETVLPSAPQNVGTYTVTISIPATDTYTAVGPVTVTVTINPAEVTVSAENKTSAYAETPKQLTYTVSGLCDGDSLASQVTLTVYKNYGSEQQEAITLTALTNAGTYTIVPSTTVSSNYTLTLTNGSYTVTKYKTTIYVASWISPQTFNGGTKTAYAAPNVFIGDYYGMTLEQEVLDLLGNYTLSYSVNFPEGVVPANNLENETEVDDYYTITPSIALANKDNFNFVISTGAYRIDPAEVTLKAGNASAEFNGGEKEAYDAPTLYYVYVGNNEASEALRTALGTVTLAVNFPETGVVNAGTYTITPHYTANNNLIVTTSTGTYTINTKDLTDEEKAAIYGAFGIVEVTYDAEEHTMYTFDASGLPLGLATNSSGYSVSATINGVEAEKKTDAGTYLVSITFTITDATINQNRNSTYGTNNYEPLSYTFEVKQVVDEVTKYSSISQKAITITADNKGHTWGRTPATLTPATAGINGEVNVTFTVKNNNNEAVTLSQTTPAGTYTIVPSASTNANYEFTFVNGTYTIEKANPVLEIDAMSTFYNDRLYIYSPKITVGNLVLNVNGSTHDPEENPYGFEYAIEIWKGNQKVLDDAWMSENYWLDAGDDYTAKLVLTGNDNYNSASASSNIFAIWKVYVDGPKTITYSGNTVTWSEVTKDVNGKDLHNSTVTYTISGTEYANRSFTATAKGTYRLYVTPSNTNYEVTDFNLDPVYSVTFLEGTHTANPATPTNMPAVQYVFKDQKATRPETNPSLTGYTFAGWNCDSWEFNFNEYIINDGMVDENGDCKLTAQWNINYFTVTVSTRNENGEVVVTEYEAHYNQELAYIGPELAPFGQYVMIGNLYPENFNFTFPTKAAAEADEEYTADDYGKIFGFDTWMIDDTEVGAQDLVATKVTSDINVTIRYKVIGYTKFEVTYKLRIYGNTDYTAYATESVHKFEYTEDVDYETLAEKNWFARDTWYLDEERNIPAPATMPNRDITVYGAYVFDIGTGDVNGDGTVDANDITLYRQWIVGGYSMTFVEAGKEWETATASGFNPNGKYYLAKVADNNGDTSKDIRDVSVTRMAIVGGYTWEVKTGLNVTGQEIMRNERPTTASALAEKLASGNKINLVANINDPTYNLVVATSKDVYLDLRGYTVTVNKFTVASEDEVTITILNGTIRTSAGITISAPSGDVVLTDLEGYDANGLVNLAAGSNSLHLNGVVEFYSYQEENEVEVVVPAAVHVEKNTHVVVEAATELVVAKLVVTENFVPTVAQNVTISVNNLSAVATVAVQGNYVNENEIHDLAELKEAALKGGSYVLANDFTATSDVYLRKDFTLDLNGYTITFTGWGFEVTDGAKFTLNGNGGVSAVEAPLYATNGATLVVNGGTYSATDNFVVGTHGNAGRGGNTILINGGTFNGSITSAGYVACGVYVANRDTVTITAGTFTITNGVGLIARCGETTIGENVIFNVTGNGTLGKIGDSSVVLPSGAVLVVDFASNYPGLNDSFVFENNTSYPILTNVASEAQLRAAFEYEGTVVLLADINLSREIVARKNITLNLNGHKLYNTTDLWANEYYDYALIGVGGGNLTINGEGLVDAKENDCYAVEIWNGGSLVINGGTYVGNITAVYAYEGNLVVNGGNFSLKQLSDYNDYRYELNCYDSNYKNGTATIVVNGGSFENFDPANNLAEGANTCFVDAQHYTVEDNGVYTVAEKTYVSTQAELVAAFENGGYVVLNNNIELTAQLVSSKVTTLDLNGHKLYNETVEIWNDNIGVKTWSLISVQGGTLTINGEGELHALAYDCYAVDIRNGANLVINGGKYIGNISAVYVNEGHLVVNGGEFSVQQSDFNSVVNQEKFVLNCLDAAYADGSATIVVNGGSFKEFNPMDCVAEAAHTNFLSEGHTVTSQVVEENTVYTVA